MTRLLQICLPAFFNIGWIGVCVLEIPSISKSLATGEKAKAVVLIASLTAWVLVSALLTYGSWKRWRWAFWAYVLLLVGFVLGDAWAGFREPLVGLLADGLAAFLLALSVVGLVRFGPWAVDRRMGPRQAGT
jgi:quinol-cytochrome oxidoreductase complex cytochrome b subunit